MKTTDFPKRTLLLPIYKTMARDAAKGVMHMAIDGAVATVRDSTGKEIGSVNGCLGGAVEIHDFIRGETWTIRVEDFWYSLQTALAQGEGSDAKS